MTLTRRGMIGGMAAGAAMALAPAARAAQAARRFTILRDGSDIGRHEIRLIRQGADVRVEIDIEIVVRVLGIAAYRYEMTNREVWRDGLLQSVDCMANDDGDRKTLKIVRAGDRLEVDSGFYSGPAPGDAATTTYHAQEFLKRGTWISTDSGELYDMAVSPAGRATLETGVGPVDCALYRATNNADFDVTLYYAQSSGEWASVAFDAGGERALYRPESLDPAFDAIWRG
jgi:hypothetical protein